MEVEERLWFVRGYAKGGVGRGQRVSGWIRTLVEEIDQVVANAEGAVRQMLVDIVPVSFFELVARRTEKSS